jgi:hypothetical protein
MTSCDMIVTARLVTNKAIRPNFDAPEIGRAHV